MGKQKVEGGKEAKTKAPPKRVARWISMPPLAYPWPVGVVRIEVDRDWGEYLLRPLEEDESAGFRAYELCRLAGGTDPERVVYRVVLSAQPDDDRCDCKGQQFQKHCKHTGALRVLLKRWEELRAAVPQG
jgi:hypothetical protein